jgi:signal transduction histidine kinase
VADEDGIIRYLYQNWIGGGHVHLSALLTDHIVAKTWEIYANAFDHANSPVGIFSCGQYYPHSHLLKLTVVDFGVGIPNRVRKHLGRRMNAAEALQWAFERGNSTKADEEGIARGMGLDLLREFVRLNQGKLEVFSYDGYARIDRMQNFGARHPSFLGTVVNITFSCDESYYRLASEPVNAPLF